ncbi:MAG: TadE family protein [Marinobacter sp.]|uniref:TadE/TadG family type IV pilus assembly protein n=1 Tax=Marinobacter sp. TaxID=50741 RepID=UPI00299D4AC3|nr:TadE family protein [Marinobacter sp.]MDX1754610.1 TadE family protein [Marinobacter sp.]
MKMKSLRYQQGTEVVEFAITASLLFLILFGIIEFSVALFDKATLTNASREGARAGILYRNPPSEAAADAAITDAIENYENFLISLGGEASLTTSIVREDPDGDGFGRGDDLIVTITYPYQYLILSEFIGTLGGELELTATTVMRAE